ncbi:MAG: hypothetical protein IJ272_02135 [Clostridia bacterium]|nr:hypothetical protein [Clostridia bacterium]
MYGYQMQQPYWQMYQPNDRANQFQPMQRQSIPSGLLGKSVDSIEVVKAMDIPLDGSISYFPLTDGTAIVTKKLQTDGTSKTVIYRPVEGDKEEIPQYATIDELIDFKEDLKSLKKELKTIKDKLKDKED